MTRSDSEPTTKKFMYSATNNVVPPNTPRKVHFSTLKRRILPSTASSTCEALFDVELVPATSTTTGTGTTTSTCTTTSNTLMANSTDPNLVESQTEVITVDDMPPVTVVLGVTYTRKSEVRKSTPMASSSDKEGLASRNQLVVRTHSQFLYMEALQELDRIGYLFSPDDFQFLGKSHVTAQDNFLYHRAATFPATFKLQVNIRVIDFLNYYKTHEIIHQLRQIIPHVTFIQNILINKQVQNACGYVAANVASQCALLFHTSASDDRQYQPAADHDVQATLASAFRRLTPWNCMFEDACHPMNVARGNAVLTGDADRH